jgi:type IV pilus assembly protein PilP
VTRRVTAALIGASLVRVLTYAQAPPQPAPPAAPPAATAGQAPTVAAPSPPPASDSYTYQPDGRRDPFLNLLDTGSDLHTPSRRDGLASFSANEISVRGVMQSRGQMVAMIQGPDNKTYIVHQGEKLLDGTIKSIMSRGIVVDQQVNDPLSIVKHRETTKLLRSLESGRE